MSLVGALIQGCVASFAVGIGVGVLLMAVVRLMKWGTDSGS